MSLLPCKRYGVVSVDDGIILSVDGTVDGSWSRNLESGHYVFVRKDGSLDQRLLTTDDHDVDGLTAKVDPASVLVLSLDVERKDVGPCVKICEDAFIVDLSQLYLFVTVTCDSIVVRRCLLVPVRIRLTFDTLYDDVSCGVDCRCNGTFPYGPVDCSVRRGAKVGRPVDLLVLRDDLHVVINVGIQFVHDKAYMELAIPFCSLNLGFLGVSVPACFAAVVVD